MNKTTTLLYAALLVCLYGLALDMPGDARGGGADRKSAPPPLAAEPVNTDAAADRAPAQPSVEALPTAGAAQAADAVADARERREFPDGMYRRPDSLDEDDATAAMRLDEEHGGLLSRFDGEDRDGSHEPIVRAGLDAALLGWGLPPSAVKAVDCRRTLCRSQLTTRADAVDPVLEVNKLIRAARMLHDETWVRSDEEADGTWTVEFFSPRQGFHVAGGVGPDGLLASAEQP